MKHILTVMVLSILLACTKSSDNNTNNPGSDQMTGFVQGTVASNDTAFIFNYATNTGRLVKIDNVDWQRTLLLSYFANNQLAKVEEVGFNSEHNYTYNSAGRLEEVLSYEGSNTFRHTFEYDLAGKMIKRNYFSFGSLDRSYTYQYTGNNITTITELNAAGAQVSQATITYTNHPLTATMKLLALANARNRMGLEDLLPVHSYFNSNLPSTITSGTKTATFTYTEANGKIKGSKTVTNFLGPNYTFTRTFNY